MSSIEFSRALADLMRERVIEAQHYIDEHRDLEQLGMPVEIVRHAMDRKTIRTEPIEAIKAWNGKGLLGLHHARDNGKTHAVALWVRARRRDGKRTAWVSCPGVLSFDELDSILRRTLRCPAVVLDDVGPGLAGTDGFKTKLAAWLQERGHLPTILTSNANKNQLEQYIGARVMSRMRQAGALVAFEAEAGLRSPDHEEIDDDGRGQRWARSQWLVGRFGCEPCDTMANNRVVRGYRVGDALETARLGMVDLEALAMSLGLSLEAVESRIQHNAAEDERARQAMQSWCPPVLGTMTTMAQIIEDADRDVREQRRSAKIIERSAGIEPTVLPDAPKWARDQGTLAALGFRVVPSGDGFVVQRRPPSSERGTKATTMSPKLATVPSAWEYAARLCAL